MPRGIIAGFPRPLTEGEIVINSGFAITDDYGANLENSDFRANEEDKMEQIIVNTVGGGLGRDMAVKLGPAGNMTGIQIATSSDVILSEETRGNVLSVVDIERVLNEIKDTVSGITGFRVPTSFPVGFAETVDEPYYGIESE